MVIFGFHISCHAYFKIILIPILIPIPVPILMLIMILIPIGLLMLVALFESTAIKFFPWLDNEFIRLSGGYPTPTFFRLIAYGKICGSIVSSLCQLVVIAVWRKNNPSILLFIIIIIIIITII